MKYKVSKELFEAVTGNKYGDRHFKALLIPYDTFFFKCKEWAYDNKYDIWSVTWGAVEFQCNEKYNGTERITADSEQQAVFDACEKILKLLNK